MIFPPHQKENLFKRNLTMTVYGVNTKTRCIKLGKKNFISKYSNYQFLFKFSG